MKRLITLPLALLLTSCSAGVALHYPKSFEGYQAPVGSGYTDSVNAALAQGEGKAYEEMKDFVEDGDYIGCEVIHLDDGTIIILDDDDVYVVDA